MGPRRNNQSFPSGGGGQVGSGLGKVRVERLGGAGRGFRALGPSSGKAATRPFRKGGNRECGRPVRGAPARLTERNPRALFFPPKLAPARNFRRGFRNRKFGLSPAKAGRAQFPPSPTQGGGNRASGKEFRGIQGGVSGISGAQFNPSRGRGHRIGGSGTIPRASRAPLPVFSQQGKRPQASQRPGRARKNRLGFPGGVGKKGWGLKFGKEGPRGEILFQGGGSGRNPGPLASPRLPALGFGGLCFRGPYSPPRQKKPPPGFSTQGRGPGGQLWFRALI